MFHHHLSSVIGLMIHQVRIMFHHWIDDDGRILKDNQRRLLFILDVGIFGPCAKAADLKLLKRTRLGEIRRGSASLRVHSTFVQQSISGRRMNSVKLDYVRWLHSPVPFVNVE